MKNLLTILGILIPFLYHVSTFMPDINMQRKMSQAQNLTQWCELLGMQLEECEKMIDDASADEAIDESGDKVLVAGVDSSDIEMAVFDACNVRMRTVYLPKLAFYDAIVWPPCIRLMRCGGCTTSEVLSCEPKAVKEKFVKVIDSKLPYPGAQRFDVMGVRVVKVLEHLSCQAQCKTKESDCNVHQMYDSYQCSCICSIERIRLLQPCPSTHMWDEMTCNCICRNKDSHNCQEPAYFHEGTCKCTLKTSVAGEIDMDKLIEQLKKGLISADNLLSGTDTVLEKTDNNTTETLSVPVSENERPTGDESGDEAGDETGNQTAGGDTEVSAIKEGSGKEQIPESLSSKPTTSTKTTQPKTTTPTTTTENPCKDTICIGHWKPTLLPDGNCRCTPPNLG